MNVVAHGNLSIQYTVGGAARTRCEHQPTLRPRTTASGAPLPDPAPSIPSSAPVQLPGHGFPRLPLTVAAALLVDVVKDAPTAFGSFFLAQVPERVRRR